MTTRVANLAASADFSSLDDLSVLADAAMHEGGESAKIGEGLAAVIRMMQQQGISPDAVPEFRSSIPHSRDWCTGSLSTCTCSACQAHRHDHA